VQADAAQRVAAAEAGARAREEATRRLLEGAKQVWRAARLSLRSCCAHILKRDAHTNIPR
jgi:hypothetical protein